MLFNNNILLLFVPRSDGFQLGTNIEEILHEKDVFLSGLGLTND